MPEGATWEYATWDYTKQLIIDRETETLEYSQNRGAACKISRKYEVEWGIKKLLDSFNADDLFSHIKGNGHDVVENPKETKDYRMYLFQYRTNDIVR